MIPDERQSSPRAGVIFGLVFATMAIIQMAEQTPFSLISNDLALLMIGLGMAASAFGQEKNTVGYYVAMDG